MFLNRVPSLTPELLNHNKNILGHMNLLIYLYSAGDGNQGLRHARQVLYH
jgi:hypothetical protein